MSKVKEPKSKISPEEAKEVLAEQRKQVEDKCGKELQAAIEPILKKHNCSLLIRGQFIGNQIQSEFVVSMNEAQAPSN